MSETDVGLCVGAIIGVLILLVGRLIWGQK